MAAEEGTGHHDETEWEAQKENFTKYYKTENRTLKDAARCMIEYYDFSATPRQWERKVKLWGLEKYTSRQDRLKQIESQGRSVHDVARAGRRPRAYDAGLLHPEHGASDDRNIRRFARREMNRSGSRSRSRSRSNSIGNRSRSASPMPDDQPLSEDILNEDMYDLDFGQVLQAGSIHAGAIQVPAVLSDHDSFGAQAHVLQLQNSFTGEVSNDLILSLPGQGANQNMMQTNDAIAYNQYQFADLDRRYSLEATRPPQIEMERPTMFPALDTTFEGQDDFIQPPAEIMDDISPTVHIAQDSAWMSQSAYGSQGSTSARDFSQGSMSRPQSYHATPSTETGPMPSFQGSIEGLHTPTMVVPELVFPPPSPSPAHFSLPLSDPNGMSSSDQHIFADFHASVNRYSQAVINVVHSSASSGDVRSQVLKRLEDDLNFERDTFMQDMTMHLSNFVLTQQRAAQSIKDQSKHLRRIWHIEKMTLESENTTMKRIVQQIPGATEQMAHQHRFSLPSSYSFTAQSHAFAPS